MSEVWIRFKSFQSVERGRNQEVRAFISEFDHQYNLAKAAGCKFSYMILAIRLLEVASVSENEKFILKVIDFDKGNLEDHMKASWKKFQSRTLVLLKKGEINLN